MHRTLELIMLKELTLLKGLLLSRLRNAPSKLNLNITALCNSQCRTCNIWNVYRQNPAKVREEMTADEIKQLLRSLGSHIQWLTIAGGEPFLYKGFEHILQFVIDECPSIRLLSIPSNGLDTGRIMACLERIKNQNRLLLYVTFSIDGPPEVHDFVRGVDQGYARTWKTYTEAKKLLEGNRNFRIALESTISKYNANQIEPFIKKLISENHTLIVTVAHNAYQYKNEQQESQLFHESSDKVKAIVENVAGHIRGLSPEKILKKVYLRNCVRYIENPGKPVLPCTALQNSIVVDPYGTVFPCTMWNRGIGNIREHDYNLMALWNTNERRVIKKEIIKGQCPGCWTPCEAYQSIAENFYRLRVLKISGDTL